MQISILEFKKKYLAIHHTSFENIKVINDDGWVISMIEKLIETRMLVASQLITVILKICSCSGMRLLIRGQDFEH